MIIAKINGVDEWWCSDHKTNINHMIATTSIETGIYMTYQVIDKLPKNLRLAVINKEFTINIYKPMTPAALSNATNQYDWRQRRKRSGYRELRMMVPNDRYKEAQQYCEDLT